MGDPFTCHNDGAGRTEQKDPVAAHTLATAADSGASGDGETPHRDACHPFSESESASWLNS
jgi:hypothetical protein